MKKRFRIFKFDLMILLLVLSLTACASKVDYSSYIFPEYKARLDKKLKRQLNVEISDEKVDDQFTYKEKTYISDLDGKWNYYTMKPKKFFYNILKASSSYLYLQPGDDAIPDIIIIPDILSCKIKRIGSKSYRTGNQNETIYQKRYHVEIKINVQVVDSNKKEILSFEQTANAEYIGEGRVGPLCASNNCWDWANGASISRGVKGALNQAINKILPSIDDMIYSNEALIDFEKKKKVYGIIQ